MLITKLASRFFVALLLGITFSLSNAQAQENSTTNNPLQDGSRALQFQISNNFNLSSFSGTTFSYKWQLSDVRAKRVGISFNNGYDWTNSPDSDNNGKASTMKLNGRINYTWMNYTNPEVDIKFFYGYGPGVNWKLNRSVDDDSALKMTRLQTSYVLAGLGYVGVEWFFQTSMSLHAEYRASIRVDHRRNKLTSELNGEESIDRTNHTGISLGGNGVRFGLSVYF